MGQGKDMTKGEAMAIVADAAQRWADEIVEYIADADDAGRDNWLAQSAQIYEALDMLTDRVQVTLPGDLTEAEQAYNARMAELAENEQ